MVASDKLFDDGREFFRPLFEIQLESNSENPKNAKCRQIERFRVFCVASQASDVGSIPIARWLPGMTCYIAATMPKHKVGDRVLVKLSGGRIVEATIKALVDTTQGIRLQVDFG
jgi:hypothetical protein